MRFKMTQGCGVGFSSLGAGPIRVDARPNSAVASTNVAIARLRFVQELSFVSVVVYPSGAPATTVFIQTPRVIAYLPAHPGPILTRWRAISRAAEIGSH